MNDMPREDENKNIGITEQLFTQYLVQWREHLDKVKYFPNLDVTTNCQAFQDLVNLGKNELYRSTVITLIEKEYREYVVASDRYRAECEADPERMHQDSTLQGPSTRVWNYFLTEIDPSFRIAMDSTSLDRRSRDIRDTVLNHFVTLGVASKSP